MSFVINIPLEGCHSCGAKLAVACNRPANQCNVVTLCIVLAQKGNAKFLHRGLNTLAVKFRSFLCHFQSLCTALADSAKMASPEFV